MTLYRPVVESDFNPTSFLLREKCCRTKIEYCAVYTINTRTISNSLIISNVSFE